MQSLSLIEIPRRFAGFCVYLFIKYSLPLSLRIFGGCKKSRIGACTILAPPMQMLQILEGTRLLQTIDAEMFQRLTVERRYMLWYHPKYCGHCREIFSITDNFLNRGSEGVSVFCVQCVLEMTLESDAIAGSKYWTYKDALKLRNKIQHAVFDWAKSHRMSPELVMEYAEIRDMAELEENDLGAKK
jgi:hypothetical protein